MTAISKLKPTAVRPADPQATEATAPDFGSLPDAAYVRASELIRSAKNPAAPLPLSASTLWRLVKERQFPAPVRLGAKTTAWRVADIRQWLAARQEAV